MCASITGDWTNCQFNNGGDFVYGDDIYIAQGSMGYSWFNSKAVAAVNDIITFNSKLESCTSGVANIKYCDTYNSVICNLGTSDGLHYTASTYKSIYSNMISCGS